MAAGMTATVPLVQDGVADGTRTHDNRNHNPGLYQLSYSHHVKTCIPLHVGSKGANYARSHAKNQAFSGTRPGI